VRTRSGVVTALALLLLWSGGCGSITRTAVDGDGGTTRHYKTRSGQRVRVQVGNVSVNPRLDEGLRQAVARYLRDQASAALGRHDIFQVTDRQDRAADLLGQFMQADTVKSQTADTDAMLHIEVTELQEHKGATVRVGLLSQQRKFATAEVRMTLVFANGDSLGAMGKGKAAKGAWGVVAMTDRRAMDRQGGVWQLDGSMAGTACAEGLQVGVGELAERVHRKLRRLKPAAVEQWQ